MMFLKHQQKVKFYLNFFLTFLKIFVSNFFFFLDSIKNDSLNECNAHYLKILDNIKMADLKKCPHLFDGCKVNIFIIISHMKNVFKCFASLDILFMYLDLLDWFYGSRRRKITKNTKLWWCYTIH